MAVKVNGDKGQVRPVTLTSPLVFGVAMHACLKLVVVVCLQIPFSIDHEFLPQVEISPVQCYKTDGPSLWVDTTKEEVMASYVTSSVDETNCRPCKLCGTSRR